MLVGWVVSRVIANGVIAKVIVFHSPIYAWNNYYYRSHLSSCGKVLRLSCSLALHAMTPFESAADLSDA